MKRKIHSAYASFGLLLILALLSFSSNPPDGNTGAPGDGICSSCHNNPPAGVQGLVLIEDLPAIVDPNTTYSITVRTMATSGSPATGGFQLVALDDNNLNIGDLMSVSGDVGTNTAGNGREYIEQRGDKAFSGSQVSWTFNWTAPAAGGGNVNMYASSNLSNNQSNTGGDRIVSTVATASISGSAMPPNVFVTTYRCFLFWRKFRIRHGQCQRWHPSLQLPVEYRSHQQYHYQSTCGIIYRDRHRQCGFDCNCFWYHQ